MFCVNETVNSKNLSLVLLKWVPDCSLEFLNSLSGKDFFNTLLKNLSHKSACNWV
jgi:hypothetical protein